MPSHSEPAAHDRIFKAIANADRRLILDEIRTEPKTTTELCTALPHLDRTTVMLHLRVLESAGLLIVRRKGRYRWNYLDVAPIQAVYDRWIKSYAAPTTDLLLRLKTDLEENVPGANGKSSNESAIG